MGTSCICSSNNICQIPTFVWNIYIYYITNVTNEGFLYLWVINLPLIIFLVLLYEDSYDLIRIFIFQSKNNIICTELDICCCILIVGLAFFRVFVIRYLNIMHKADKQINCNICKISTFVWGWNLNIYIRHIFLSNQIVH